MPVWHCINRPCHTVVHGSLIGQICVSKVSSHSYCAYILGLIVTIMNANYVMLAWVSVGICSYLSVYSLWGQYRAVVPLDMESKSGSRHELLPAQILHIASSCLTNNFNNTININFSDECGTRGTFWGQFKMSCTGRFYEGHIDFYMVYYHVSCDRRMSHVDQCYTRNPWKISSASITYNQMF